MISSGGFINRCELLSVGEVGLNSHHPETVPAAALIWA